MGGHLPWSVGLRETEKERNPINSLQILIAYNAGLNANNIKIEIVFLKKKKKASDDLSEPAMVD